MSTIGSPGLSQAIRLDSSTGVGNDQAPRRNGLTVALLTGGADRHYALGLATALIPQGAVIDVIGSNELDCPDVHHRPGMTFLNLRGDQDHGASFAKKVSRVLLYYARLIRYSATAKPGIFHILWNNKFEFFDRTFLMLYYKFLRKKIVLTVHNVNKARRDGRDTRLNRLTLRIQYRLSDHMFVHTEKMKLELIDEFGEKEARVTLIPYGINNSIPQTDLDSSGARQRLGIREAERTILFFGNIAPYKGLEYLVLAFRQVLALRDDYRLIIAGRPKNCETYWRAILDGMRNDILSRRILLRAEFIPDEETEIYFKAADVLVLPYTHIYQSGVLSLGYSFGLPVIGTDVGSFREDILEGKTGFLCRPSDPVDLARAIQTYFESNLYRRLAQTRRELSEYAQQRCSWHIVAEMTCNTYDGLERSQQ
jgi:glycosyltransferase involved in cell wall biosynthesis